EQVGERPEGEDGTRDARSIADLKMLHSVAARLNRFNSVKDIGEAIASELRILVDYHSCRVYLCEDGELVPVTVKGHIAKDIDALVAMRIKVGEGITGHVAATGKPVLLGNAVDSEVGILIPGTDPIDESVIAVPLRYGQRVVG